MIYFYVFEVSSAYQVCMFDQKYITIINTVKCYDLK